MFRDDYMKRLILVAPIGKIIIYPTKDDENIYPGSLVVNEIYLYHLIDNYSIGEFREEISKEFQRVEIENKEIFMEILEHLCLVKYFEKTSGT